MSVELQQVRQSQEELRAERRMIFDKLREMSKCFGDLGRDDARLAGVLSEMAALVDGEGMPSGGGRASTSSSTVSNAPPCRTPLGEAADEDDQQAPQQEGEGRGAACSLALTPEEEKHELVDTAVGTSDVPGSPCSTMPPSTPRCTSPETSRGAPAKARSWLRDSQHCAVCLKRFSVLKRRHHCRSCGRNVCGECSPYRVALLSPLPHPVKGASGPHRVCVDCHEPLEAP